MENVKTKTTVVNFFTLTDCGVNMVQVLILLLYKFDIISSLSS